MVGRVVVAAAFVLALIPASRVEAQTITLGVKAGGNLAGISTDEPLFRNRGSSRGFVGGGSLAIGLAELSVVQVEVLYSRRGFTFRQKGIGEVQVKTDYIEVPILLKGQWTPGQGVKSGIYVGAEILFEQKCALEGAGIGGADELLCETADPTLQRSSTDYGLVTGFEVVLPLGAIGLSIEGRYNYGLSNLSTQNDAESIKSRVWTLMGGLVVPIKR